MSQAASQAADPKMSNASEHSTAYYFLEGLNELGIEHLFCNFGTDHAPIIEEMANRTKRGEKIPNVMLCPHENTAAHMAMGYAMVTGRGQAVLVHVDVGTANTANGMHNLFRSRLPALLMSGKAPYTSNNELVGSRDTYVHFVQEPVDQGSLVRPYVKWEWTLPSGVVVKEALRRAHTIMETKPAGPVYFMAQRETLTQKWASDQVRSYSANQFSQPQLGGADPAVIAQLADRILAAEHPILICGYAGQSPTAPKLIEELAQFAGIAVFEGNQTFNISHEFPCFLGYSPNKHLPKADFGLLVDVDVPWFASDITPNDKSFWAHIDIDTLKAASPMWTFPGNVRLQGDSGRILGQLLEALKAKATPKFKDAAAKRVAAFETERKAWRENVAKLAVDKGKAGEINPHYLFSELNKLLKPDDIVMNEGVRNAGACLLQLTRSKPNTCMRSGGGGLGWSGAAALGAKLAAPDNLVIQVVGDGGFYFGNPSSVFAVARQYKLPILVMLLDNTGWSAVKESTLRVFPKGEAKSTETYQASLMPDADFAKVGEAFGAYGERVSNPDDVPAALARCIKEVRGGRAAILHARVTKL
jgi:acetolactate synthase-1/2/3 large subunit